MKKRILLYLGAGLIGLSMASDWLSRSFGVLGIICFLISYYMEEKLR